MGERNDGGPAFPMPASEHSQGGHFEQLGMSLRDWFAGKAMAGMLADPNIRGPLDELAKGVATESYVIADAMLAARARPTPTEGE